MSFPKKKDDPSGYVDFLTQWIMMTLKDVVTEHDTALTFLDKLTTNLNKIFHTVSGKLVENEEINEVYLATEMGKSILVILYITLLFRIPVKNAIEKGMQWWREHASDFDTLY